MSLHLAEIGHAITPGAQALVVLDGADWHGANALAVPPNPTLRTFPPHSPELNSVEKVWQFLRQNRLANRVFESYATIVDAWLASRGTTRSPSQIASASVTSRRRA